MYRVDVINYYLDKVNNNKFYLEIGVNNGATFKKINATFKDGVDPKYDCNFKMESDKFFQINKEIKTKYDVVFIDGNHIYEQVYKDINNSINILNKNGVILIHDCNPPTEKHQIVPRIKEMREWNGTVWKAFVNMRMTRKDLYMFVIDIDWGIGVIKANSTQNLFSCKENIYDYQIFNKYRKQSLNLISAERWRNM